MISASYLAIDLASTQECSEFGAVRLTSVYMCQTWDKSIFAMDLNGVQSVSMAGIILTLPLCVYRELGYTDVVRKQFEFIQLLALIIL